MVSELLAFSAVVDWPGSSVLCGFQEGGEEVESFVDNGLGGLCIVYCNDDGGVGFAMSLSGRGEVAGKCLELDVRVVVLDLMLEFLHPEFIVWEEGKVDSVDGYFRPRAVGDDGEDVAFG